MADKPLEQELKKFRDVTGCSANGVEDAIFYAGAASFYSVLVRKLNEAGAVPPHICDIIEELRAEARDNDNPLAR